MIDAMAKVRRRSAAAGDGENSPAVNDHQDGQANTGASRRGASAYLDAAIRAADFILTKMTRDGVTPSQSRTWEYWTVPEQFETIRQDFDSSETAGGFGAAPGSQTILKAEFDQQYGYPRRYQRFVLGTDLAVEWDVTHFAPVE